MRPTRTFTALALLAAIVALPALPATAKRVSKRTTFLLARSYQGYFPNGPSRNGAISHDQRIARYMAFESDATDLVEHDTNGFTDVFLVRRKPPWGNNGTPWVPGTTEIVSLGMHGEAANGRSYRPAVDGDAHHRPHCVAFISDASNLVAGDTNGKPDAFVRDMRTRTTRRISAGSGSTSEVAVDGRCERVVYVSDASGRREVYLYFLDPHGLDAPFKGRTVLVSANNGNHPAIGDSYDVSFARAGKAVAFTSVARNLARGDHNTRPDVYLRTITRKYVHLGHGRGRQRLVMRTRLVSATPKGRAGDGPSGRPSVDDFGRYVAFQTDADDILPRDLNHRTDVARADMAASPPAQRWVSRSAFSGTGNGPSRSPVISDAGQFVLFESDATNLRPSPHARPDTNGVTDVFLWNGRTGNVSLESRDSSNHYLPAASGAPSTSSRGNYVLFQGGNPKAWKKPAAPPPPQQPQGGPLDPALCIVFPNAGACKPVKQEPPPPDNEPRGTEPSSPMPPSAAPQLFVRYLGPQ
jgi:hypothetical protein